MMWEPVGVIPETDWLLSDTQILSPRESSVAAEVYCCARPCLGVECQQCQLSLLQVRQSKGEELLGLGLFKDLLLIQTYSVRSELWNRL